MEPFDVVITRTVASYPTEAPFHPDTEFPEYPFRGLGAVSQQPNHVYAALRNVLRQAQLDNTNYGRACWNPLGHVAKRGDAVLLKPNLVFHTNQRHPESLDALITHASVVRAMLDYVFIALRDTGQIAIADAPLQSADFATILATSGLASVVEFYRQVGRFDVPVIDLRAVCSVIDRFGAILKTEHRLGDPRGAVPVNLGAMSMHHQVPKRDTLLRVSDYDAQETVSHHSAGKHEYQVAQSVLDANLVINMPKLKTHCKAGITIAMKNLIGINVNKSWLPHYAAGSPSGGGDEYAHDGWINWLRSHAQKQLRRKPTVWRIARTLGRPLLAQQAHKEHRRFGAPDEASPISGGAWHGNDTLWRTIIDLNRILFYARPDGTLAETPQRKYLAMVDGVIAGEGEGPLLPDPLPAGVLLFGQNPVAVDWVGALLLGIDPQALRQLTGALWDGNLGLAADAAAFRLVSDVPEWHSGMDALGRHSLRATMPAGWRGQVELKRSA
jgi:uncharacterized protein (DUF362 family)